MGIEWALDKLLELFWAIFKKCKQKENPALLPIQIAYYVCAKARRKPSEKPPYKAFFEWF